MHKTIKQAAPLFFLGLGVWYKRMCKRNHGHIHKDKKSSKNKAPLIQNKLIFEKTWFTLNKMQVYTVW